MPNPTSRATYSQILKRTSGGSGAIHREIRKFLQAGLVVQEHGAARLTFAPNRAHASYNALHALTSTLVEPTRSSTLEPAIARRLAKKYLWWLSPGEAVERQDRLVAQVMNMGTFDDIRLIEERLGEEHLRRVLLEAAPGWFDDRPWTFWHYRLGVSKPGRVPELPRRRFG